MLMKEKELLGFFLTGHPMDEYRALMKKLGSQGFDVFPKLEDKSVVRSAFIVESVKTRISAKSQRKFAILTISDGVEHKELPVWANMYQEKAELCEENKLLFGFLQIEHSEGVLRLRCRELLDLASIEQGQVQEIDTQFDTLKKTVQREAMRPEKSVRSEKKGKPETMLNMKIAIDNLRFSHILKLKTLLEHHGGGKVVKIIFTKEGQRIANLAIDPSKGVEESDELKNDLKKLSFIQSFSFEPEHSTM